MAVAARLTALLRGGARPALRAPADLAATFPRQQLTDLAVDLAAVEREEQARQVRDLGAYLTLGAAPLMHVVEMTSGLLLHLADGTAIAVGGVAHRTRRQLHKCLHDGILLPATLTQDGPSWRLLLRTPSGAHLELHAQRIALLAA